MSIQKEFSEALLIGLSEIIKTLGNRTANELEFRLGTFNSTKQFNQEQNELKFKTVIEQLQRKKYELTEEISLDISLKNQSNIQPELKNLRITIIEIPNIRKFCMKDRFSDINQGTVQYLKKVKLEKYDYFE